MIEAEIDYLRRQVKKFPDMLRAAKADSWDEGWQKAHATDDPAMAGIFFNPYRSQA